MRNFVLNFQDFQAYEKKFVDIYRKKN